MNFKLTKKKIIVSIGVVILWYILMFVFASISYCNCYPCPSTFKASDCVEFFVFDIIPNSCSCGCTCPQPTPILSIFFQLFIILFPGLLLYVIWSLIEKKK